MSYMSRDSHKSAAEDTTLVEALRFAVPLWINEIAALDDRRRQGVAREAAAIVGTYGDVLLFRSKHPERTMVAFNQLARGLAALAYQPGGVRFADLHWCVDVGHSGVAVNVQCNGERQAS